MSAKEEEAEAEATVTSDAAQANEVRHVKMEVTPSAPAPGVGSSMSEGYRFED